MSKLFGYRVLVKNIDEDLVDDWAYENLGWCWAAGDPNHSYLIGKKAPKKLMRLASWAKGHFFLSTRDKPTLSSRYYYFVNPEDVVAFKLVWDCVDG